MSKIIDADELTINALLDHPSNAFVVPPHQRQYEWTREQWNDLWNDLHTGAIEDTHFLGSIVVIPSDKAGVKVNYFEINDGQQRLTTLLILISAIRDQATKIGNTEFAQFIFDHYLSSNYFDGGTKKIVPKMVLGELDDLQFKKVREGKLVDSHESNHRIFDCYYFFSNLIAEYDIARLEELEKRVTDKIIIVHINVSDKLNAFRLFETLNDRGLALSAVDLIKNHLLMRAASDNNELLLNSIVQEWQEMYQKIRDYDPVTFFYRFILSEYPGKVSVQQLYEAILKKAKDNNWNGQYIYEFTVKLKKAAIIYAELMEASTDRIKVNRRLQDIKLFEASPSYTLLLKITPLLKENKISEETYLRIIDLIELFHIRWGITGQSTSRLNDIYNRMCNKIDMANTNNIFEIVENEFLSMATPIADQAFQTAFQNEFAQPSATRTKYILWKLGEPAGEISLNFDEVHTEHIMPQTLSHEWIDDLRKSTEFDDHEILKNHTFLKNKIGNFLLIKGEWNIRMSNKVFTEKVRHYDKSEILLTKEMSQLPSWTFDDIVNRTEELSNKAVNIWKFDKPIPQATIQAMSKGNGQNVFTLDESVELFCQGPEASAKGCITDKTCLKVLKGSIARKETSSSFNDHGYLNLRMQLIRDCILADKNSSYVFDKDYVFQSASAASSVVLGRSSNGLLEWKDKDGIAITKYLERSMLPETDEETINRAENVFVKDAVKLIPEWIQTDYPSESVYITQGQTGSNRSLKRGKEMLLYYYYANNWVFCELQNTTKDELELLQQKLTKKESLLDRGGKYKQVRFHLINHYDLELLKEIINKRVQIQ